MAYIIKSYNVNCEEEWDSFVLNNSYNGSFLQTRKFLNYHEEGKYKDNSLMFYCNEELVAVIPGCMCVEDGKYIFYSHPGTTYGGVVVSAKVMRVDKLLQLLDMMEDSLRQEGFYKIILKQQNSLMSKVNQDLIDFCLFFRGYNEYKELNLYVDLDTVDSNNIVGNFSKLKKRQTKKCIDNNMVLRELTTSSELSVFLDILAKNLKKYGKTPYHTVSDLVNLKKRFPEWIQYWACEYDGEIVAVSMVFLFVQCRCAHTHYLASDPLYNKLSPMTYIYYKMVDIYKEQGYKYLSWGIATEHNGIDINYNLANTKEEFGSLHNVVRIYEKDLEI